VQSLSAQRLFEIWEPVSEDVKDLLEQVRSSAYQSTPGACIIKLITAVIYCFHNELVCLSLNTKLDWKGLPGTNWLFTETVNYGRNKFCDTGPRPVPFTTSVLLWSNYDSRVNETFVNTGNLGRGRERVLIFPQFDYSL
jgi:hypothetical protein